MARSGSIKYYFLGDSGDLKRAAKDSEDALGRLNANGERAFRGMRAAALLTAGAVAGIGFAAVKFGIDSVKAFGESEAAMAKVKAMVEAAGISWKAHGDQIERVIQIQSRKSGFDDEKLALSFANLAGRTKDFNEALRLNALAMDLARGRNIDLERAADIVGRVHDGNVTILRRYGVQVDKNTTSTEALAKLQARFAGQTDAFGRTQAGMAAKAGVAWDNLKEAIGGAISPVIGKWLPTITAKLEDFADWVEDPKKGQGIKGFFTAIAALIGKVAEAVVYLLKKLDDLAKWLQTSGALGAASRFLGMSPDVNPPASFYGGQQPRTTVTPADPSRFRGGQQPRRAMGGFVPGSPPAWPGDNMLIWARSGEAILTEPMQHDLGMARVWEVIRRHGGKIGGDGFATGGIVTASWFNDASTASGRNASTALGWAELSNPPSSLNYSALGGLPMGAVITVAYKGRAVSLPKIDVGAGGGGLNGHVRAIDLSAPAKTALGFPDLADVTWSKGGAGRRAASAGGGFGSAAAYAERHAGDAYSYGVYDCADFATLAAKAQGASVTAPGSTATAWAESTPISGDAAAAAPVVWGFYSTAGAGGAIDGGPDEHMGIRINGTWWDNSRTGGGVRSNYRTESFWNKGLRLPRGLSATGGLRRGAAGSPGTRATDTIPAPPPRPTSVLGAPNTDNRRTGGGGPGQGAGSGIYNPNRDNRAIGGPAGSSVADLGTYTLPKGFAGGRAPTSNIRFDTRDEPGAGGVARPGGGQDPRAPVNAGGGAPEAAAPAAPPTLGQLLAPLQADIRKNWSLAQLSGDKAQQIAVAQSAVAVYGQILAMAVDIGDPGLIADAADTLRGWQDTLKGLQQATDPANDPDLQAQLAQANQRAATNLRAFNLGNAFIHTAFGPGDLGRGGASAWGAAGGSIGAPQVVIQSLTPSDPTTLGIIANTVARAQAGQGFVPTSAISLGV